MRCLRNILTCQQCLVHTHEVHGFFKRAALCAAQNLDINVFVRLATPRTHPFSSASLCAVQSGHTALDIAKDKGHTAIEALLQHKGAKIKSEL